MALVEAYAKEQGLWHDARRRSRAFSEYLELDLGDVVPSIAGPKRPQDRIALTDARSRSASARQLRRALTRTTKLREELDETFPPATAGQVATATPPTALGASS